jgi:hypothetical protein
MTACGPRLAAASSHAHGDEAPPLHKHISISNTDCNSLLHSFFVCAVALFLPAETAVALRGTFKAFL